MTSRSVGPCERSYFVFSIAFSAISEAAPRYSSRSSSCVISWKLSDAPVLLGFDLHDWTELFGSYWPRCRDAVVIVKPEMRLRAMPLQAFYSIRSERRLMERLEFDLLFRWLVALGVNDPVRGHSTFSKNRDRLLEGEIASRFLEPVAGLRKTRFRGLPSVDLAFTFVAAACDLVRLPKLLVASSRPPRPIVFSSDGGGSSGPICGTATISISSSPPTLPSTRTAEASSPSGRSMPPWT